MKGFSFSGTFYGPVPLSSTMAPRTTPSCLRINDSESLRMMCASTQWNGQWTMQPRREKRMHPHSQIDWKETWRTHPQWRTQPQSRKQWRTQSQVPTETEAAAAETPQPPAAQLATPTKTETRSGSSSASPSWSALVRFRSSKPLTKLWLLFAGSPTIRSMWSCNDEGNAASRLLRSCRR